MRTDAPAPRKRCSRASPRRGRRCRPGFTTVRELGGRDYHDVSLRNAQRNGPVRRAAHARDRAGRLPDAAGSAPTSSRSAGADSVDDAVKRVRQLVAHGVDVIKIVSADGPEPLGQVWTIFPTREEIRGRFAEATRGSAG